MNKFLKAFSSNNELPFFKRLINNYCRLSKETCFQIKYVINLHHCFYKSRDNPFCTLQHTWNFIHQNILEVRFINLYFFYPFSHSDRSTANNPPRCWKGSIKFLPFTVDPVTLPFPRGRKVFAPAASLWLTGSQAKHTCETRNRGWGGAFTTVERRGSFIERPLGFIRSRSRPGRTRTGDLLNINTFMCSLVAVSVANWCGKLGIIMFFG